ncbi:hypothetical protein KI387_029334, partial [Taxus chinensis]
NHPPYPHHVSPLLHPLVDYVVDSREGVIKVLALVPPYMVLPISMHVPLPVDLEPTHHALLRSISPEEWTIDVATLAHTTLHNL